MKLTFKGGIHPDGNKELTNKKATVIMEAPDILVIPLSQHIGAPCESVVKAGDSVTVGQKIADSSAFVSAPIHSSVSGVVKAVEKRPHATLGECMAIVIENDKNYTVCPDIKPLDYESMTQKEIIDEIRNGGIVGMGGAAFPTSVKLSIPEGKTADTFLVNAAECEPYLTSDHRLMLEKSEAVIGGIKIALKATGIKNAVIAMEDNKKDAYEILSRLCENEENIKVITVKTKYPQGSEKQLIDAVLKRQVKSGTLPVDSGAVVQNVASVAEIYNHFKTGLPLIERIVTVSGRGIENPVNIVAKIGTSYREICEFAGGMKENVSKVISGGPMMGFSQYTLDVPVTKGTSGILFFTDKEVKEYSEQACIKCGKCVSHCPMKLMPFMITEMARIGEMDEAVKYGLKDCMECGSCSFICPQRRHLVQHIRVAKAKLPK